MLLVVLRAFKAWKTIPPATTQHVECLFLSVTPFWREHTELLKTLASTVVIKSNATMSLNRIKGHVTKNFILQKDI